MPHSGSSRAGSPAPDDEPSNKSSATQIRKAQNRIAQREFRLRKQQYIRDLEARVEILSGDKDERIELMLLLVRNLLHENKELRNMVKDMSQFFGEGLGSCLPRLGLTPQMLDAILNRADTDTAYEAFVQLKASKEQGGKNDPTPFLSKKAARGPMPHFPPDPSTAPKRKRRGRKDDDDDDDDDDYPVFDFTGAAEAKKARGESSATGASWSGGAAMSPLNGLSEFFSKGGEWDFLFPDPTNMGVATPGPGPSTMAGHDVVDTGGFPVRMGGGGPPLGAGLTQRSATSGIRTVSTGTSPALAGEQPPLPSASGTGRGPGSTPSSGIHDVHSPNTDVEHQRSLRAAVAHLTNSVPETASSPRIVTNPNNMTQAQVEERRRLQEQLRKSLEGDEETERKTEALQLITYHLNNFRINHEYKLPPSLMPTTVQRTMPHEHAIDGIVFPSIRDRMILLRGKYDLVEAFHGYITEFTLHGDDALDHRNWEASERWLQDFGELADEEVFAITNRWRAHRGRRPVHPASPDVDANTGGLGTGASLAAEFLANQ
ncbi:uncharacterized protein CcaverHIS019_0400510 [Cutaneotrichosporon cavernicola]|uniref:BZIP domain-containing protein n=1 Tax=Cutaneotrichosporon cavernicola TaxID=279322 RepID=A0AA48QVE4_9TREE|nr:uncharacterized protein CcaverHIS019_0400510 [Cutaneotrichosporon cavernicola]BEI91231.1 hypothetical protein CcaverHIS019_0400510 [Cutaneotrichosporon cavernicola]BEI99004.1 hypothetical protein CcaverHIS631_0400470 [Cutaneotrichosporon cavernicola]BEJ06778.1 hypothetical protein CcaverHIS641_0400470 [Cutaneotrichosporon cavernicola]